MSDAARTAGIAIIAAVALCTGPLVDAAYAVPIPVTQSGAFLEPCWGCSWINDQGPTSASVSANGPRGGRGGASASPGTVRAHAHASPLAAPPAIGDNVHATGQRIEQYVFNGVDPGGPIDVSVNYSTAAQLSLTTSATYSLTFRTYVFAHTPVGALTLFAGEVSRSDNPIWDVTAGFTSADLNFNPLAPLSLGVSRSDTVSFQTTFAEGFAVEFVLEAIANIQGGVDASNTGLFTVVVTTPGVSAVLVPEPTTALLLLPALGLLAVRRRR